MPRDVTPYRRSTRNYPTPTSSRRSSVVNTGRTILGRLVEGVARNPTRSYQAFRDTISRMGSKRKASNTTPYQTVKKRRALTNLGHSIGVYKGKFRKPRKIKRTMESQCLSKGYHKTVEQFGLVQDSDSVFLTHSTVCNLEVAYVVASALLRTVLTKAGLKVTNQWNEMEVSDPVAGVTLQPSTSAGLRFHFTTKNASTGSMTGYVYTTIDNQNFRDLTNFGGGGFDDIPNRLIDYWRNTLDNIPYKLAVYVKDEGLASTFWRLGAEMYLEDAHIQLSLKSTLTCQNRTKAATAAEGAGPETDRVDSQPLRGMIYDFKHADPRVRHSGPAPGTISNQPFNQISEKGITLIKGSQFVGATEPFVPKYWANISKAVPITLQPGEMKKTHFMFQFSGKLINVMKKMKATLWFGATGNLTGITGKSQMVCFEEQMRTPTANKINIAYQRELKIGAIVKNARPQGVLESLVAAENIDNV